MLYWLPRVCVLLIAGILIGFGLVPYTAAGVAHTLLIIILGLGLLSLTQAITLVALFLPAQQHPPTPAPAFVQP